jgi:hypothetical protein
MRAMYILAIPRIAREETGAGADADDDDDSMTDQYMHSLNRNQGGKCTCQGYGSTARNNAQGI